MKNTISLYKASCLCLTSCNDGTNRILFEVTTEDHENPRLIIGSSTVSLAKNKVQSIQISSSQYPASGESLVVQYVDDETEAYLITLTFTTIDESKNMTLRKVGDAEYLVQYANTSVDAIVNLIYPVGSIYMSVNPVNPSDLFTGTTWEAWGSGRVPVGVNTNDVDFKTVEKTGGQKQVTQYAWIGAVNNNPSALAYAVGTPSAEANSNMKKLYNGYGVTGSLPGTINNVNHVTYVTDSTGNSTSVIQPYITCYMWKRTA